MSARRFPLLMLAASLALSGCSLRIGWPSQLPNPPAPTSIQLAETADPSFPSGPEAPPSPIFLPPGFTMTVFASGLDGPRMMAIGPGGQLYVAERGANRIVRLPDENNDGQADGVEVYVNDLNEPSSLVFHPDGSLFVGETTQILRIPPGGGEPKAIINELPGGGHTTRTVLLDPHAQALFVSIGSSCNVCQEDDPRRAAILRYNLVGANEEIFARGLRNAVGITFRPGTDELWATNNGRDFLGDDLPPETIYQVTEGSDYGWPRCHSGRIIDPDYGSPDACQDVGQPQIEMQAHSAPLGLVFYNGDQFPPEYRGDLFVAFHGSWNRSKPTGYKVVHISMEAGTPGPVEDFAVGWLQEDGSAWGRPVDLVVAPDGSMFVSDDAGGAIYRIVYLDKIE